MDLEYELVQASQQIRAWRGESPTLSDEESVELARDLAGRSHLKFHGVKSALPPQQPPLKE